jgi:hypothetical protein
MPAASADTGDANSRPGDEARLIQQVSERALVHEPSSAIGVAAGDRP